MLTPKILFEDNHLLVVDKPAGMLSQGDSTGEPSLVDWARHYVKRNYIGLIHRLDRNVSGVILLGKRTKASRRLTESLQEGKIKRIYRAWVNGRLPKKQIWQHYLIKDEKKNKVSIMRQPSPKAKEAVLEVIPKQYAKLGGSNCTLVEYHLKTGRSHQIRVQSSVSGFPIIGDPKYGSDSKKPSLKVSRPLLHAYKLHFPHPMTQEEIFVESPMPQEMVWQK